MLLSNSAFKFNLRRYSMALFSEVTDKFSSLENALMTLFSVMNGRLTYTTRAEPLYHNKHAVWRTYPRIWGHLSTDQPAGLSLCTSKQPLKSTILTNRGSDAI